MSDTETVESLRARLREAEAAEHETQVRRVHAMDAAELADLVDLHCTNVRSGYGCDDCAGDCWHEVAVGRLRALTALVEAGRPGGNAFVTPGMVRDAGIEVPAGVRVGTPSHFSCSVNELQPGDLLRDVLPGMASAGGYLQVVGVTVNQDESTEVTTRRTNTDEPVRSWSYPAWANVSLDRMASEQER